MNERNSDAKFGAGRLTYQRRENRNAGVAQSAEHVLGKDGVTGSIPVSSLLKIEPVGFDFQQRDRLNARNYNIRVHSL